MGSEKGRVCQKELKKIACPQQKARLMVYQPPTEQVKACMLACRGRCGEHRTAEREAPGGRRSSEEEQSLLAAQQKASEAMMRLKNMRRKHQQAQHDVISLLTCHSSVLEASRLQLLLQPAAKPPHTDSLTHAQRRRVEAILADDKELTYIFT